MGVSDKTARSYLDISTGTFMVQQLQSWFENIGKRQIKSPKIYLRDTGLLHHLLGLTDMHSLLGHPKVGTSWEGYVLEQVQQVVWPGEIYFWATHGGTELDFFFIQADRRFGVAVKYSEAPKITKSMRIALEDLGLDHLRVIYAGEHSYPADDRITVWQLHKVPEIMEV